VSWADANLNDDPGETLGHRITELEHTVASQLSELRNEVGLAAAAMRAGAPGGSGSPIGDLEQQLARAVTVSLSAALEAIREALTEAVAAAVTQLGIKVEATLESQVARLTPHAPQVLRPTWDSVDLENVSASLQHSVLLALSSFEQANAAPASADAMDTPATARDVARVNQRLDELRALLLG
jgi:hypothetical protein